MAKPKKRERKQFNVWAAYVDMFSNLMALLLMAGLVAAAAGGSVAGTKGSCQRVTDSASKFSRLVYNEIVLSSDSLTRSAVGPNCEFRTRPAVSQRSSSPALSNFEAELRFETGRDVPLGNPGDESKENLTRKLLKRCEEWFSIIREARAQGGSSDGQRAAHITFVGHASREWGPVCKGFKRNTKEGNIMCNMQLSLSRAQRIFRYCYDNKWNSEDPNLSEDDISNVVSVEGTSGLDASLISDFNDADQRRVTVSIYIPTVKQ